MSAQECFALLVFAAVMTFTPGPNTTLSTALAVNFGLWRALPVGWSLLLLLCGAGLGVC
jgi:threonine/homoserine/homoserine lactone efflux protein